MNNTKIEWCNSTWNPVTGCLHDCKYCYARKIANRFGGCNEKWDRILTPHYNVPLTELDEPLTITRSSAGPRNGQNVKAPFPFGFDPTFHKYRLDEPQKWVKPRTVFVGSMTDLFGEWVPDRWIKDVFAACEKVSQHRYLFLTKNPKRYVNLAAKGIMPISENMLFGATVTNLLTARAAANAIRELRDIFCGYAESLPLFLSVEPLLEDITCTIWWKEINDCYIDWVIIGAETGNHKNKVVPSKEWIDNIVNDCKYSGIPVFMKDSLIPIIGEENMRRNFPWRA